MHAPEGQAQEECCRHLAAAMWRRPVCNRLKLPLPQSIDRGEAFTKLKDDGLPNMRTLLRYRTRIECDTRMAGERLTRLQTEDDATRAPASLSRNVKADDTSRQ